MRDLACSYVLLIPRIALCCSLLSIYLGSLTKRFPTCELGLLVLLVVLVLTFALLGVVCVEELQVQVIVFVFPAQGESERVCLLNHSATSSGTHLLCYFY